ASGRARPSTPSRSGGYVTDPTIITGPAPRATAASPASRAGDALGKARAAEHAAVCAYGVIGGKSRGWLRAQAAAGFDAHRARRDQLRSLMAQRGGAPAEPGPAYRLPFEVRTPADAIRLAVLVEERLTTAYLELAAE